MSISRRVDLTRIKPKLSILFLIFLAFSISNSAGFNPIIKNVQHSHLNTSQQHSLVRPGNTATTINVPDDYATIQAAIDAASDGDTVLVSPGTYVENINFNGKNIIVGSLYLTTGDTSYISQTVIDGNDSGAVVTFINYETSSARLTGFTLINGLNIYRGGGIYCSSSSPSLDNLTIQENVAHKEGGGAYFYNSSSKLEDIIIEDNKSYSSGGGLYIFASDLDIRYATIRRNEGKAGGGVYIINCSPNIDTHG